MSKSFVTWIFHGTRFLAIQAPGGYAICNETGEYFGSWQSHEEFRRRQRMADSSALESIGKVAKISVWA